MGLTDFLGGRFCFAGFGDCHDGAEEVEQENVFVYLGLGFWWEDLLVDFTELDVLV